MRSGWRVQDGTSRPSIRSRILSVFAAPSDGPTLVCRGGRFQQPWRTRPMLPTTIRLLPRSRSHNRAEWTVQPLRALPLAQPWSSKPSPSHNHHWWRRRTPSIFRAHTRFRRFVSGKYSSPPECISLRCGFARDQGGRSPSESDGSIESGNHRRSVMGCCLAAPRLFLATAGLAGFPSRDGTRWIGRGGS